MAHNLSRNQGSPGIPSYLALGFVAGTLLERRYICSSYVTEVDVAVRQSVPFSHEHHVSGLGIDCRYCHVSVENSSYAGVPPTETCMTCHSQIWNDSPMLAPVRASYETNTPLKWNRVHNLPDHVYFNHSIHVQKGVGCVTCHGRVDQMPQRDGAPLPLAYSADARSGVLA
jgi:hypothetical protein